MSAGFDVDPPLRLLVHLHRYNVIDASLSRFECGNTNTEQFQICDFRNWL